MRQEQGRFRSFDRGGAPDGAPLGADTNPPRGSSTLRDESSGSDLNEWNHIDTSGAYGLAEASEERGLREIRFSLRQENSGDRKEEGPRKTNLPKPDGFVPFLDEEPKEEYVFVNNYGGAYSQKMELNRSGVERALKIARLQGKVFLTTLV